MRSDLGVDENLRNGAREVFEVSSIPLSLTTAKLATPEKARTQPPPAASAATTNSGQPMNRLRV